MTAAAPSTNLATALAAVQGELPHVDKGKTAKVPTKAGGSYTYDYADLADVAKAVHPLLSKHGLAFVARPTLSDTSDRFVLAYALMHGASGESLAGEYPLPDPARSTAQEVGSAITYARRYTLTAVTGVVPDDDDDAAMVAPARDRDREPEPPPRPQHVTDAYAAIASLPEDDRERLRAWVAQEQVHVGPDMTQEDAQAVVEQVAALREAQP